ncbi:hypothetical protein ACIGXM_31810 [Kitasatospora sp. NPDC052896]|uniref:hypothetical protein n=1 Tax=Kitasatospora sp. NPDC052896 TaxID=3364061 RepID=UPI0037C5F598
MTHEPSTSPDSTSTPAGRPRPTLRTLAVRAVLGTASTITIGLFLILVAHLLATHQHALR